MFSLTHAANSGHTQASLLSPKLSMVLGPWQQTEFFFNAGRGFHSNDARGTSATQDPKTGEPISPVPGLVAALGWELVVRTERIANLQSSLALWQLQFDSELVYVGDAEDNSVRSHPASTLNLRVSRDLRDWTGLRSTVSVDVFNVLNAKVNDIQYYYASQLPGESAPVMDRVVHPAEPLSVRVTYRINF